MTPAKKAAAQAILVDGRYYVGLQNRGRQVQTAWALAGATLFLPNDTRLDEALSTIERIRPRSAVRVVDVLLDEPVHITAAWLREAIKDIPDDMPVVISGQVGPLLRLEYVSIVTRLKRQDDGGLSPTDFLSLNFDLAALDLERTQRREAARRHCAVLDAEKAAERLAQIDEELPF